MNINYDHIVTMDCANSEVLKDGYYFTRYPLPPSEQMFVNKPFGMFTIGVDDTEYDISGYDVIFTVDEDGHQILAHRRQLASKSVYFQAMFSGHFLEAYTFNVKIHNVSAGALKKLVKFCYKDCIKFESFDAKEIVATANLMLFQDIVKEGLSYLTKLLYPQTCLDIYAFAQEHKFEKLASITMDYINVYFLQVVKSDQFLNISFEILIDIIDTGDKINPAPLELFDAVLKWIDFDESLRKDYIRDLLSRILPAELSMKHFPLIEKLDIKYIRKQLECEKNLFNTPKTSEFIHFLITFSNSLLKAYCQVFDFSVRNYVSFWEGFRTLKQLDCNVIEAGKYLFQDKIIVAGGMEKDSQTSYWERCPTNKVAYLSLQNLKFYNLPSMNIARRSPGVAVLDNAIYVCGGDIRNENPDSHKWGERSTINCVERYDPVKKIWTTVTPMINKRSKFSLYVTGNNRMYAVGGTDEPKYKDYPEDVDELLIEFYDSKNNEWTTIAKVSKNCDTFWDRLPNVSFVFNNSLHTFFKTAGYPNYLRTGVLKYDEHSNSWIMVRNTLDIPLKRDHRYSDKYPIIYKEGNTLIVADYQGGGAHRLYAVNSNSTDKRHWQLISLISPYYNSFSVSKKVLARNSMFIPEEFHAIQQQIHNKTL